MMKKNLLYLVAIMMATMLSVGFASCSSDDDNPSLSFTKEIIVGKWKISNIYDANQDIRWFSVGDVAEFKSDGTCRGWFSMETAYKIESGRIHTYYKETDEPMFVYTLLSQNGSTLSVRMNGTLDDNSRCSMTLQKVY